MQGCAVVEIGHESEGGGRHRVGWARLAGDTGRAAACMAQRPASADCGVPASEVLMIGDTYRADVAGPQAAGMRARLLDRRGRAGTTENSWRTLDGLV
ncbi:HAD hydrolase-like protein [Stenotrophomonas nitritireducens]|uniref:HAD hydrolase-like protein n=1 Tax=Stenotrophomonas nitritireducens TaxID=83617 RepID=UPI0009E717A7